MAPNTIHKDPLMTASSMSLYTIFYRLKDNFFDPAVYVAQMEAVLNGMIEQGAEAFDINVVSDVTESLFPNQTSGFLGSDLVARNIHRGRDHGLPGYNEFR